MQKQKYRMMTCIYFLQLARVHVCLKCMEKALEKYPPNCNEEESNGSGDVHLFSTFL